MPHQKVYIITNNYFVLNTKLKPAVREPISMAGFTPNKRLSDTSKLLKCASTAASTTLSPQATKKYKPE